MLNPIKSGVNENLARPSINSKPLEKAEAMAIFARRLFDYYHQQELAANPEIFLTGVVELFCGYPHEVVCKAVSPMGLPSRHKFPPRLSEIKEYLDERMEPIWREQERDRHREPSTPALPAPKLTRRAYTYSEFLEMAERGEVKSPPIGRFEDR